MLLFLTSSCKNEHVVSTDEVQKISTLKEDTQPTDIPVLRQDSSHIEKIKKETQPTPATKTKVEQKKVKTADEAGPATVVKPKKKKKKNPPSRAKIEFKEMVHDYGEIESGDEIEHNFVFTNEGKAPLNIISASATCGCTVPSYPFLPIEPGEEGRIGVYFNSVGKEGIQEPIITVTSDGNPKITKLKLKGKVLPKKKNKPKQEEPTDSIN